MRSVSRRVGPLARLHIRPAGWGWEETDIAVWTVGRHTASVGRFDVWGLIGLHIRMVRRARWRKVEGRRSRDGYCDAVGRNEGARCFGRTWDIYPRGQATRARTCQTGQPPHRGPLGLVAGGRTQGERGLLEQRARCESSKASLRRPHLPSALPRKTKNKKQPPVSCQVSAR